MKKYLLLFGFLFMAMAVNAQSFMEILNNNNTSVDRSKYNEDKEFVIQTQLTKNAMWINLKKWVSSTFNSYKHVVDLEDKEGGILIIKWQANMPEQYSSDLLTAVAEGTLQVDVRDNKFRIRRSDEYISTVVHRISSKKTSTYTLEYTLKELNEIKGVFKSNKTPYEILQKDEYPAKAKLMYYDYLKLSNSIITSLKKQMVYVDDF